MYVSRNMVARSRKCCCRAKARRISYSECLSVALVIQQAKRMRRNTRMLPSVDCPAVPYFSTLSHKLNDFREKVTEHKMCVLTFSTSFVKHISHYKKN